MRICLIGLVAFLVCLTSHGDPLNGGLDLGTSTSQSYEARNVFIQPAALGFDTALNGADLTSSIALGHNWGAADDYSLALAYGYVGFGAERFSITGLSRFQLAAGIPLTPYLFFGTRVGFYRYDSSLAMTGLDFGVQLRPSRRFSLGVLFNQVNQPVLGGSAQPFYSVFSATFRPFQFLDLTVDTSTASNVFFQTFSSQAMIGLLFAPGVKLRVGYHTDYKWLVGLQVHFGTASVFSSVQPSSASRQVTLGFQAGTTPYRSAVSPPKVVKVSVGPGLSEEKMGGSLLTPSRPSLLDLLKDFEALEKDRTAAGVLLHIENFPLGLASAQEIHAAIHRLRKAGKTVEAYLGNAGMKEYLIASAADSIYIEPAGEIRWMGLRSERYFIKGSLDKLGVEAEFLAAGKYKSAPEMFTRKSSSDPSREATQDEIKTADAVLFQLISKSREIDTPRWNRLLELGLLSAEEAQREGLVDGSASYSGALARYEREAWVLPVVHPRREALALPARVAVVVASGNILPNRIRLLALTGGEQVTPAVMETKIRLAESDSQTRAVLLRVSSPGGEVLASQQIASRLEDLKKEKSLTVSMGDVAASGGYYLAAPGGRIFANPLTLTGSIGVFLGKFNFSGLFRFLDLHKEVFSQSPYPGLYSEERPWTKAEKAVMERRLTSYYDRFVGYVAKHRHLPKPDVLEAAGGRVWLGNQALTHRLVDELGGYHEAIRFAASEAGYDEGEYETWEIETPVGLLQLLEEGVGVRADHSTDPLSLFLTPRVRRDLEWISALRDAPYLYLSPVTAPDA